MKSISHFFLFCLSIMLLASCTKSNTHNGHPVIQASSVQTEYKIDTQWHVGWWSIAPQVAHDTLKIQCINNPEKFVFKTDKDSIAFDVEEGKSYDFYVHLKDSVYAHTIITGIPMAKETISHAKDTKNESVHIQYDKDRNAPFLKELDQKYPITSYVSGYNTDLEKILSILNWTRSQWEHDGNQSPSKSDAITILDEVKAGSRFPCFAYAIVLKSQLENAGFKSRTVYLKTKDVETRRSSPGHVATEVYSEQYQKWIFIDGQFNVMPVLNSVPLNAVEFQQALTSEYDKVELHSKGKAVPKREYVSFVYDYLYYFDTSLDHRNRIGTKTKRHYIDGKGSLMLVPMGANNPTKIDFWNSTIDYCIYTNSLADFYAKP
ncbi:transglutaminase domain-containing protein [Pseudotenacibaculum haliotis]|uniref:Transglutaminase domain-containing protein n=1 Tax=Pseudotenacibaculum haliotis TaxID=1862138 RepID=A0ABW5LRI1_9FLAO